MNNKDLNNKGSLNNKIVNIIIFILWIVIICMVIISIIAWKKTDNFILIIAGTISVLGCLFNIHLLSTSKSKE